MAILRDYLLIIFSDESKIINLIFTFLEAWTLKTPEGRTVLRGIPHGNFVSRFLGNLFLLPIDKKFKVFEEKYDVKYYRYMDDVRIFTKRFEDARLATVMMDRELKRLHLNIQTTTTKIFDQKRGKIKRKLIDDRVDKLSYIIDEIEKNHPRNKINERERVAYLKKIDAIANQKTRDRQKILGATKPLNGLDLRTFLRWIHAHNLLYSDRYIDRIVREIQINTDPRITKRLTKTTRLFPNKRKIGNAVLKFLKSDNNTFPYQEEECLRALRYLSYTNEDLIIHCCSRLFDYSQNPYVRMQSAYLLSRNDIIMKIIHMFNLQFQQY